MGTFLKKLLECEKKYTFSNKVVLSSLRCIEYTQLEAIVNDYCLALSVASKHQKLILNGLMYD